MNITISGHHLEVTPSIRDHIQNKLERITRHYDQVIDITVTIAVDKLKEKQKRHKIDVNLHVPGKDIHAESMSQDLYAAIDLVVDKLDRQVIRHKDKIQHHKRDPVKHLSVPITPTDDGTISSFARA